MLDKDRMIAGAAATVVAALIAIMALLPVIFAEPPPDGKKLSRAIVEKALGMLFAGIGAYISAPWAADMVNEQLARFFSVSTKVDTLTAAVVVAVVAATLTADPTARQKVREWLSRKVKGAAS